MQQKQASLEGTVGYTGMLFMTKPILGPPRDSLDWKRDVYIVFFASIPGDFVHTNSWRKS